MTAEISVFSVYVEILSAMKQLWCPPVLSYWRWSRLPLGKKWRVLRSNVFCHHDCLAVVNLMSIWAGRHGLCTSIIELNACRQQIMRMIIFMRNLRVHQSGSADKESWNLRTQHRKTMSKRMTVPRICVTWLASWVLDFRGESRDSGSCVRKSSYLSNTL